MNAIHNSLSVAWKDLQIILRDRGLLLIILLLPLLFGTMLSLLYTSMYSRSGSDEGLKIKVFVVNLDEGAYGGKVAQALNEIELLVVEQLEGEAGRQQADQAVAVSERAALIVIPADFSARIEAYEPGEVQVFIDPTQQELGKIVLGVMNYAVAPADIEGNIRYGIRSLASQSPAVQAFTPEQKTGFEMQNLGAVMTQLQRFLLDPLIAVETSGVEAEAAEQPAINFFSLMIPGFTVMFAFFLTGSIGARLFVEKDQGTMRRLLTSPVARGSLIGGIMLAYGVFILLQATLLFGISAGLFGMDLGDSPLGLVLVTLGTAVCVTSFGVFLGALARTGKQADSLGTLLGFILAGLGGCIIFSIPPMYEWGGVIGTLSRLTPQSWALEGYYKLTVEGAAAVDILPQVGMLLLYALVFFLIASRRLGKFYQ
jgi:ABC-2 type transport system permease protein